MMCACGSNKDYVECCGVFITGTEHAPTPEALMRSRYTAFTEANIDYIARTMKGRAADRFKAEESRAWAEQVEWLKLEIIETHLESDTKGFVEFTAHFLQNKKRHVLHEISEFHAENGVWYYVDGKGPEHVSLPIKASRVGRNDACLCGSGKKYKKCCGFITKN